MYVWKCWRDSRGNFIVRLIALPALCVFLTYMEVRLGYGVRGGGHRR
jgi:hypothetical protein